MNDSELLRSWVEQHSEEAFAELVRRHLHLVYGSAMRQLGHADLAQDVCQAVFLALAQKASRIGPKVILSGWLFRTTCHIAARAHRSDYRRQRRELESAKMNLTQPDPAPEAWSEVAPHLDAALATLPGTDRDLLVLRYFERQPFREVSERCGISEEAAKKRVGRAVEKLRRALVGRGVTVSAAVLSTALLQLPTQAIPQGLLGSIITGASTGLVSTAINSLTQRGLTDLLLDSVRRQLPLAAAVVLMLSGGVWMAARKPSDSSPPLPQPTAKAGPVGASSRIGTSGRSVLPGQRGPCRIELGIVAAENNQPLLSTVLVRGFGSNAPDHKAELATDAQGRVEIPVDGRHVDHLQVFVSSPGRVPLILVWSGHEFVEPVLQHTTRLAKGRVLEGTVRNEKDQPVGEATITFNNPGVDLGARENVSFHSLLSSLKTDSEGRFRSDQLPMPQGELAMSYSVDHPDYIRETVALNTPESVQSNQVVILKSGLLVGGKVVDADGHPVARAKVAESDHFGTPHRNTTADDAGEFKLGPFPPGEMRLEASADGFQESNVRIEVGPSATNLVLKLSLATGEPSDWARGMAEGATIQVSGTVVDDASGEPLSRFRVRLDEHRGTAKRLIGEGHDGQFSWPVFMAFYQEFSLHVDADGYAPSETDLRPVKAGSEAFVLRLKSAAAYAGQVVSPSGEPVSNAFVGLNGAGFSCMLVEGQRPLSPNDAPQTMTDAEGRFTFHPRAGSESLLVAHESGCTLAPIGDLAKGPIVLQPWGSIQGILKIQGQPAAGQGVNLDSAAMLEPEGTLAINIQADTTTDGEGRFEFRRVPAGTLAVCRYFNDHPGKTGPVGMSHYQKVIVPAGGIAQVALGSEGRTLVGKLVLKRPLAHYTFRHDLQMLVENSGPEPKLIGRPSSPEWRHSLRELSRFRACQRRYYLEIEPDGSFRIPDVSAGEYQLQLTVTQPPDPDAYDPLGNPAVRSPLGKSSTPVSVSASDSSEVQDLGVIILPLE